MANSSRRWWAFLAALLLAAFGLNWLWEMLQGAAYAELARLPWWVRLRTCTVAAVGDAMITLAIFGVGALAAGQGWWGLEGRWNVYAAAALMGGAWAAAVEWRALALGLWSYNEQMPVVPGLGVGLWPLLQLTLLTPVSLWIAARLARRSRP